MKRQQIILASLGSLTGKYDASWDKTRWLFYFPERSLSSRLCIDEIADIANVMKEDLENV